jgi:hypothetical protein
VYSLMREVVSVRATSRLVHGNPRVSVLASLVVTALAAVMLVVGVSGSAARPARHRASGATGGGTSGVLNLHEGTALTLGLSGDDHSIVMNFMGNLWTMPATGGTATRISSLSQDTAYPTWSPDGKTIAFQSYKSGNFHVWAMNPERVERA